MLGNVWQGRIQEFHGGGGRGGAKDYVRARTLYLYEHETRMLSRAI